MNEIKVLGKVFGILEFISSKEGKAVLPGELLSVMDISQPTCIRILKYLTTAGYLKQVSRQKGYILGPVSFWLGGGKNYEEKLREIAIPLVRECAEKIGQSVLFAVRHEDFRVILCGWNANPLLQINNSLPRYHDLFSVISGRLLLAHAPEKELEKILMKHPEPNYGLMKGYKNESLLRKELKCLKDTGYGIAYYSERGSAAVPVFRDDICIAVIGAAWLDSKNASEKTILSELRKTASNLSAMISKNIIAG